MKPIISCLNLKGGCGKSSTIVNLGGILVDKKKRPILIDLDEQQSATQWSTQGGDKFPFPVIPLSIKTAAKVKGQIERLSNKHKADIILIDTPPQLEDDALIAALLSDVVLIPVSPSPLDLWAARKVIDTIKEARQERGGNLPMAVLIPSRVMKRTTLAKDIKESLKAFDEPISPPISLRVAIAEAAIAGLPISCYAPNSPSHREFMDLWKFINSEMQKF
ncbi:MAG: ParA family protein [Waddliaceae bacterium]